MRRQATSLLRLQHHAGFQPALPASTEQFTRATCWWRTAAWAARGSRARNSEADQRPVLDSWLCRHRQAWALEQSALPASTLPLKTHKVLPLEDGALRDPVAARRGGGAVQQTQAQRSTAGGSCGAHMHGTPARLCSALCARCVCRRGPVARQPCPAGGIGGRACRVAASPRLPLGCDAQPLTRRCQSGWHAACWSAPCTR